MVEVNCDAPREEFSQEDRKEDLSSCRRMMQTAVAVSPSPSHYSDDLVMDRLIAAAARGEGMSISIRFGTNVNRINVKMYQKERMCVPYAVNEEYAKVLREFF